MNALSGATDLDFLTSRGWLRLLHRGGPDARAWVEEFHRRDGESVARKISRSVHLIHRRQLDEARRVLDATECDAVDSLRDAPPSIRHTVDCWHASAKALFHYSRMELEKAEEEIARTSRVVRWAIEEHRFLVLLAGRLIDVEIQRAQVARKRYRWQDMERHTKTAWRRLESREALCRLSDGTEIRFSDVESLMSSIDLDSETERGTLGGLLDPRWRRRRFQALVADCYALSWMLIPYG